MDYFDANGVKDNFPSLGSSIDKVCSLDYYYYPQDDKKCCEYCRSSRYIYNNTRTHTHTNLRTHTVYVIYSRYH